MTDRMTRWFTYAVAFALLPLAVTCLLRSLKGTLTWDVVAESPDVLFFSVMVCATALGDIVDAKSRLKTFQVWPPAVALLSIAAVLAAVLYGSLVFDTIANKDPTEFRSRLLLVSAWLAGASLSLGTVIQAVIGLAEAKLVIPATRPRRKR
jgi:hypothetical protein